jgi:hypothetical protein
MAVLCGPAANGDGPIELVANGAASCAQDELASCARDELIVFDPALRIGASLACRAEVFAHICGRETDSDADFQSRPLMGGGGFATASGSCEVSDTCHGEGAWGSGDASSSPTVTMLATNSLLRFGLSGSAELEVRAQDDGPDIPDCIDFIPTFSEGQTNGDGDGYVSFTVPGTCPVRARIEAQYAGADCPDVAMLGTLAWQLPGCPGGSGALEIGAAPVQHTCRLDPGDYTFYAAVSYHIGRALEATCGELEEASCSRPLNAEVIVYLEVICPGNIDCDGEVGTADLTALLAAWGDCCECPEDLNCDGTVDAADITILLSNWGACPDV